MPADPAEVAFLASAAARAEEVLGGLSTLASRATGLSWPVAALVGVTGAALLLFGARSRRVIGAVGAAEVGALAVLAAGAWLEARWPALPRPALAAAGAVAMGLLGAAWPHLFVLAAGALPGAVLGVAVPVADRPWLGLAIGAAALGALASMAAELTAVAVAAVLGAGLLGGAALAAAGRTPEVAALAARPFLLVAWLVVVGAAGGAAQLGRSWGRAGGARRGGEPPLTPPDRPADRAARSPGWRA
jgi:hypothetical protein